MYLTTIKIATIFAHPLLLDHHNFGILSSRQLRVPHVRDSFIVTNVGLVQAPWESFRLRSSAGGPYLQNPPMPRVRVPHSCGLIA
jgi:hypothetical protein